MKKVLIYSFVAVAAVGILIAGAVSVQAENDSNYPPIIQKLAERFNLNADEVREVIDENRQERNQWTQAKFEEKLDILIANGQFNEGQKEAVMIKMNEMREKKEEFKNLPPEERCTKMEEMKEEMKIWSEENDIKFGILNGFNKGFGKGFGLRAFQKSY